jgi:hypothetical protein
MTLVLYQALHYNKENDMDRIKVITDEKKGRRYKSLVVFDADTENAIREITEDNVMEMLRSWGLPAHDIERMQLFFQQLKALLVLEQEIKAFFWKMFWRLIGSGAFVAGVGALLIKEFTK